MGRLILLLLIATISSARFVKERAKFGGYKRNSAMNMMRRSELDFGDNVIERKDTHESLDEIEKENEKRGAIVTIPNLGGAFLYAHNKARQRHIDTPDLSYDESLEQSAAAYVRVLLETGKFEHSSTANGENLYEGVSSTYAVKPVELAMYRWYEEINDFNFGNKFQYNILGPSGLGHFTQIVWKTTLRVGCAGAYRDISTGRRTVHACHYAPAGNTPGRFDDDVMDPKPGTTAKVDFGIDYFRNDGSNCVDNDAAFCAHWQSNCGSGPYHDTVVVLCKKTCGTC